MKTKNKILTSNEIIKYNPYLYEIYGDSIWEGVKLLDGIVDHSENLNFIGLHENLETPLYIFKVINTSHYIAVKICGRYNDWSLTVQIEKLIGDIDKPDFVIFDYTLKSVILAGETTDTIPLGNSELQRKGRVIVAAKNKIPFLFKCPGTHYDDSKLNERERILDKKRGQARYLMPISVIMHFVLSIRYKVPSLLFIQPNISSDKELQFNIDSKCEFNFFNYISAILIKKFFNNNKYKQQLEKNIFNSTISYLNNTNTKNIKLINKLKIEPIYSTFTKRLNIFFNKFVEYLNSEEDTIDEILKITNWNYDSFPFWKNGFLSGENGPPNSKNWLFKILMREGEIKSLSYQKNTCRPGIILQTTKLIDFISAYTEITKQELEKKLNINLPTLIIPTLAYQWKVINGQTKFKTQKKDPGTGEICHFSEFFAYNERGDKQQNILIYIYIKSPPKGITTDNSLFKAIKSYHDCLIIDDKIFDL